MCAFISLRRLPPLAAALKFSALTLSALAISVATGPAAVAAADEDPLVQRGERIYRDRCVSCHGESGRGVEGSYDDPLVGDATVRELTELIAETMPEEDPDLCLGEDAAAVASYIHHAFYSEAARVRNRPPRIDLVRLTGEQLRQSLSDLYGHFDNDSWIENRRGIEGTYFDGSRWRNDKKRIERVDPVIEFDFAHGSPGEGINSEEFYIHWGGSLKVDHTGRYEIILRSTCSCQMHFGKSDRMLINNHVQSEGKTEFRRTLQLTGGRAYPIKIEFTQRKRKTEQPPARVSLAWIPPGGVEQTIPPRNLIPSFMPAQFALSAKLPPDDRTYGYERGIAVNRQWDEATTAAALEFGDIAASELWSQYRRQHRRDSDEDRARLRGFLEELVATAFRGPLSDEQREIYVNKQLQSAEDDAEAIKRVALITLKSPYFLYPTIDRELSASQLAANRLTLVLYDSLPADRWLTERIEKGQLATENQLREAAWKMVGDRRTQFKLRMMLYRWLGLSELADIDKDQEKYPGFDQAMVAQLQSSLDAFLDEVVLGEASDYRQLVAADWTFTNERLAEFYGDGWQPTEEEGSMLRRSVGDPTRLAGALTHPLVMSRLAHFDTTSPIHRGVLLYRQVLGRTLRPPNAAFAPLDADLHPDLTTRQRLEMQTGDADCQICHQKINSLGLVLENYDSVGRFRTQDNGQPVDASGGYIDRAGNQVKFDNARDLAQYLAESTDCHRAFVETAFEHFVKQPINAYGSETADRLTRQFTESGCNIRQLIVNIALVAVAQSVDEASET